MKRFWIILTVLLIGIVVGGVTWRQTEKLRQSSATELPEETVADLGTNVSQDPRLEKLPDGLVAMRDAIEIASSLHQKEQPAEHDLQAIERVLELYRFVFKANPVGSENQEIMARLLGGNPKKLVFFLRNHPSLNAEGVLLDRWGMPYYFHPLSAHLMDVRSAGPDGKLWTPDDESLGLDEEAVELKLSR